MIAPRCFARIRCNLLKTHLFVGPTRVHRQSAERKTDNICQVLVLETDVTQNASPVCDTSTTETAFLFLLSLALRGRLFPVKEDHVIGSKRVSETGCISVDGVMFTQTHFYVPSLREPVLEHPHI